MIYLDHAATSYHKPEEVAKAVYEAIKGSGNSGRGVYGASLDTSRMIYQTREKIATLFHVGDASRVVFTANATESLNIVIQGLLKKGEHCITTCFEHNSVLRPLYRMEEEGVEVTVVAGHKDGTLDVSAIENAIKANTKAIIMTHASNVLGTVYPIREIGQICRAKGILFIVDASQTAGLLTIHMEDDCIDALCCSGHKGLLAPQGVGILCLNEGVWPKPLKAGGTGIDTFSKTVSHTLPTSLEVGTLNAHSIAGLSVACDYIERIGQDTMYRESMALTKRFIEGIKHIPRMMLYGNVEATLRIPVVSLNIKGIDSGELSDELFERFHIAVRAGGHCAPLIHELCETVEQGMVRFSFSHLNKVEEVDTAIEALTLLEEETR